MAEGMFLTLTNSEINEEEEMIINQEYKIWKKEAPHLYDLLIMHALDIPSYSFEWLSDVEIKDDFTVLHALLALNSPEPEKSSVARVSIKIPNENKGIESTMCLIGESFVQDRSSKVTIDSQSFQHFQINRARACPGRNKLSAASLSNGEISLCLGTEIVGNLAAHTSEGYGLSWNPISHNILATGQTDKKLCIWDVEKAMQDKSKISPISEIHHHRAPVQDVAWHKFHRNVLASCSDDRLLMIWDLRAGSSSSSLQKQRKPLFQIVAHTNEVYSLDFSPFNQYLLLSGSADETASVWDMRNLTRCLSTVKNEKGGIVKAQWSPFTSTIFATAGYGRNVQIWDLSKEAKSTSQQSLSLFRHGGHRSKVMDFDWNKHEKLLIGSTEESNCLHAWQMARSVYYEEE